MQNNQPFDRSIYKEWNWKHPYMLHWIINPGLMINEIFLGQRIPKQMLVEKNSKKPIGEKTFIPCPHCNALHPSLKWSLQNKTAFGNWFGLYCDNCQKIIPCIWNATSLILLMITAPIWLIFKNSWKKKWLEKQKERFSHTLSFKQPEINWVKTGLGFGLTMYIIMELILGPLFDGGFNSKKLIVGVVIWTLGGLAFGWMTRKMITKKSKKQEEGQ